MTDKDLIEEIYYNGTYNTGIKERHYEILEQYANEKARKIAEQAVDERTCDADHPFAKFERKTANEILSRIKQLTQ